MSVTGESLHGHLANGSAASEAFPELAPLGYQRGYQACDLCRERKVKCDLGPVDAPSDPPCRRCRRENNSCTFLSMRKKRHTPLRGGPKTSFVDSSASRSKRRRLVDVEIGDAPSYSKNSAVEDACLPSNDESNPTILLRRPAATSYDALSLLYGAGRHHSIDQPHVNPSRSKIRGPADADGTSGTENAVLNVWSNLHFVHTGLLTAVEAVSLVNYFYDNVVPFTPVISYTYREHSRHQELLDDEPILAMAILMISSRFMPFTGPGATSRAHNIHDTLWEHLRGMISHMIWGQEHWGGDFGGLALYHAGATGNHSDAAHRMCPALGGLRTLGTCEALVLLTEWNPRAIHFPPRDDQHTIMIKTHSVSDKKTRASHTAVLSGTEYMYAAWRSDRMCWTLLGNALTLAVELGVYDQCDNTTFSTRETRGDIWKSNSYQERASRLQHLLQVYMTHTSARLGRNYMPSYLTSDQSIEAIGDDTVRCWVDVAELLRLSNRCLFSSRAYSKSIIQSGNYDFHLKSVQQSIKNWKRKFDMAKLSKSMRAILTIEYAFIRVSANSIALQALTESYDRIIKTSSMDAQSEILSAFHRNEEHVKEVITAAKSILQVVVDDLMPDETLKYMPVRTYCRVLTGAVALWKTFALAIRDDEATMTLHLLDRTAKALRTCVVDDVHLGNRFGELLDKLVLGLRKRGASTRGDQRGSDHIFDLMKGSHLQRLSFRDPTAIDQPALQQPSNSESDLNRSMLSPESLGTNNGQMRHENTESLAADVSRVNSNQYTADFDPFMNFIGAGDPQVDWYRDQDMLAMLGPLLNFDHQQIDVDTAG